MTNHCVERRPRDRRSERGELLDAADQPDRRRALAVHEHRPGVAERVGRRHEPQQHVRHDLRRLHRRVELVHQRGRSPGRARPPSRRSRTSSGSRTRSRTSSSRTTSTASAATSCGRRARTCRTAARAHAVHANIGVEKYFFEAGDQILNRIKEVRNTAILPERTGPIADVLYSAAGNSADEHWYNRGVIAYSFETGADRSYVEHDAVGRLGRRGDRHPGRATGPASTPATRSRSTPGLPNEEIADVASVAATNPPSPAPNVLFTEPLSLAHPAGRGRRRRHAPDRCRLPAGLRDRGQARGARVRGRQLRAARVGARVREGRQAARGGR